jgi:hypothetical protein
MPIGRHTPIMPGISACHPYYFAANNAAGSALDPVMQHSTLSHFALSETPKIASFFYTATKSDGTEQGNSTCQSDRYSNQYALSLAKLTCHRQPRSESSSIQICRTKVCSPGSCVVAHVSPRQDHPLPLGGCVGYTSSAVPY